MATATRDATCGQPALKRVKLGPEESEIEPVDVKEHEAYYSANFKYILSYVLNQGKEGHVIPSSDRVIIDNFDKLEGMNI